VKQSVGFLKYSVVVSDMNHYKTLTIVLLMLSISACTTTPDRYKNKRQSEAGLSTPALTDSDRIDGNNHTFSVDNSKVGYARVDNSHVDKAQAVATASIGVPQVYVDRLSGLTTELFVQSEYFSANGRLCRRYSERMNDHDVAGVSCQDAKLGWTEIPLSSFVH